MTKLKKITKEVVVLNYFFVICKIVGKIVFCLNSNTSTFSIFEAMFFLFKHRLEMYIECKHNCKNT